uniref:Uncharacterized protein n=1 Tax=Avena sativa TaxID=4498 RepID=A0ACD5UZT2_AVESA
MPEEMMCCGTASLKDVDKGELSLRGGGGETPRKEKKVGMVAKEKKAPPEVAKQAKKKKENPYASLGLDKFSTVLAELETRREMVLRRVDGDGGDRVMVRFVQSRAKEWVPVVVRLPPEEPAAKGGPRKKCKLGLAVSPPAPTQPLTPREDVKRAAKDAAKGEPKSKCRLKAAVPPPLRQPSTPRNTEYYCAWPKEDDVKLAAADAAKCEPKKKCKLISAVSPPLTQPSTPRSTEFCAWPKEDVKHATVAVAPAKKKATTPAVARLSSLGKKVTRPSQYWPFVAVLLLVSLVVFGRVFAICCTSVWWYLVPILSGGQSAKTGKNLGKKASGKLTWPSLPPSHGKKNSSGALQVTSPRSHAHGKKG